MSNTTIIEVNGVKLEVDLRNAKRIDHFRVGDTVKILLKDHSSYKTYPGIIIGFDAFQNLPTIIIAYLDNSYWSSSTIKTICYNSEVKDIELVSANEHDLQFDKADILDKFDKEITKKQEEIREIESKKKYFLHHFKKYFRETV